MPTLFPPLPPVLAAIAGRADTFPVRRVFCVGRNYADHAREMGKDPVRDPPFFFTKWAETVVPDGSTIPYPSATEDFQFEAELVAAIGRAGRNITPDRALDHVWGYAAGLDMTRRDLQQQARAAGRPWDTGKNVEFSSPLGSLHPVADLGHPAKGRLTLTVNGAVRQETDIADLVSEYTPQRHRAKFGNWAFMGIPGGGFLGGLVASYLIPHFGWPSVYWVGGALTMAVAALTAAFLPESILFTLGRKRDQRAARALLTRVAPDLAMDDRTVLTAGQAVPPRISVASAFQDGRAAMTTLFWIAEFILLMGYYLLVNWTPTLLTHAGLPVETAVLGSVALNVGGISFGVTAGWLCDRLGARRVLCAIFLLAGLSLVAATQAGSSVPLLMAAIFVAGGAWISGQAAMMVLIADSYPTAIRGIATGWALGVGRIGAIISPAVVAIPLSLGWEVRQILLLPVLPALVGAACILFARPGRREAPVLVDGQQATLKGVP